MRDNSITKVKAFVPDITFNLNDGHLIDLLFYDQASQSFQLNPEAAELILEPAGNVGLIFNMGDPSVGKSSTLNHIMDLPPGPNSLPERTRGIKIWTKPLYRDAENLYLFFIDVEGFNSDSVFRDFVWFFSFFLGTIVIYTTSGPISDQTWSDFGSFDFISNRFFLAETPAENEYLISYYAPKFIWQIKDVVLTSVDGKQITPEKYIENCLYEQGQYDTSFFKNFFVNSFKDRSCVAFPPNQHNVNFGDPIHRMNSQYIENIKIVKEKIYSKATNKYFDGIALTSRMMVHFITCVTELLNKKSVLHYSEVFFNKLQRSHGTRMRNHS